MVPSASLAVCLLALAAGAEEPTPPAARQESVLLVTLKDDGQLLLDGLPLDEATLWTRVATLVSWSADRGGSRVAIASGPRAPASTLVHLLEELKLAGVKRVDLLAPGARPTASAAPAAAAPTASAPIVSAPAVTPAAEAAPESSPAGSAHERGKNVEATGYADSRSSYQRSKTGGLMPTDDFPQLQELVEVNAQVKVKLRARSWVYGDVSLVGNFVGNYRGSDKDGKEIVVADHKTSTGQPVVSLSELYVFHEFIPELNVLVGKKRITWGSGMAYNPTDLLNPRRDPTDPTFQRAGAWVAQVEVPLPVLTFSVLFAPQVTESFAGLPTSFVTYPSWDKQDDQAHYQAIARAYALVWDADINLMLFYGNKYNDAFEKKLRGGASFSRYFFTDYELHVEALLQSGSTRDFLNGDCFASIRGAFTCNAQGTAFSSKKYLDDPTIMPKVLVGARRQFNDESMISIEYLYQGDGFRKGDFQVMANALGLAQDAKASGVPSSSLPVSSALFGGTTSDGLPARFAFDPRGQHTLFVTFQKPRIFDDFTAQVVLIASLRDLSTLWSPSVTWSATEWMNLSLTGFLPFAGPDELAVKTPGGRRVFEYGLTPFAYRVLFEARVFY